jgi:Holliday junction resolvase-like predicted endonuclease
LAATLNLDFDSVEVEVVSRHPNACDEKAAQQVHNEQQFRMWTTKALVAQVKHTAKGANMRILANTLYKVLVHTVELR